MNLSMARDIDMKGRALFIPTLWLAMMVALLSALAPLGPPSTRQTGSAFNPATTSVVLKTRSPASLEAVRAAELPKDEPAAAVVGLLWLLPLAALVPGAGATHPSAFGASPCQSLRRRVLMSGRCARAPPAFS